MSQTTELEEGRRASTKDGQATEAAQSFRRPAPAIPPEMKLAYSVVTVAVLLLLSVVALTGSVWAFPFVYVPTVITYIAGALYLFKRLLDYRPDVRSSPK